MAVQQVFSDADHAGVFRVNLQVGVLEHPRAFEDLGAGAVQAGVANGDHRIPAETVHVIVGEPGAQRIQDQIVDLRNTEGRAGAPLGRGLGREVDAAAIARPVEAPHRQRRRPLAIQIEVVVDDIQDHTDAGLVGLIDEGLEIVGASVHRGRRKRVDRVVPPGVGARKLRDGHKLDHVDAKLRQIGQLGGGALIGPGAGAGGIDEGRNVQLVDHRVSRRGRHEGGRLPHVSALILKNSKGLLPARIGPHQSGAWIGTGQRLAIGLNRILVLLTRRRTCAMTPA